MSIEAEGKENNGWLLEVGFGDEYNPLRVSSTWKGGRNKNAKGRETAGLAEVVGHRG